MPTYEIERFGAQPYLIIVDHASNQIPAPYANLGLPADILETHIAWDIGAKGVGRSLAKSLGGVYFGALFSRLLIDPNRDLKAHDVIPEVSDQIPIPGNEKLTTAGRTQRIERFHNPYHAALNQLLEDEFASPPMVVSVHSFSPRLIGELTDRPWHIGLLWREDPASAQNVIAHLRRDTEYCIGDNEPYDARVFNYTIDRHIGPRDLRHLTFEVRQDLINSPDGVSTISNVLLRAISDNAVTLEGPSDASSPDPRH
ncbi:MAG: N-formylglutamate amidohydrolase [Pseudomonadota bacterium]